MLQINNLKFTIQMEYSTDKSNNSIQIRKPTQSLATPINNFHEDIGHYFFENNQILDQIGYLTTKIYYHYVRVIIIPS